MVFRMWAAVAAGLVLVLSATASAAELTEARRHMVSAANPHASEAGLEILRAGGSAVDAAIAMQLVLGLVEPQSSGIGGGGFLMHYRASDSLIEAYDGRETAPADLDPRLFLNDDGQPMGFFEAALGGATVGVPGVFRLLEAAHVKHGVLDWARLFEPAIRLAENGFAISPRLYFLLDRRAKFFARSDFPMDRLGAVREYFFTADGAAKPAGTVLKNPAYAATLRAVADGGADAFYTGPLAQAMVDAVRTNALRPGALSLDDLAGFRVAMRAPLCGHYRDHRLCSMGPPSSGATTLLAILGVLDGFDLTATGPGTAQSVHLYAEASKLAYADRALYIADPAFVSVPTKGLIDKGYLAKRRSLIDPARAMAQVDPGMPPTEHGQGPAPAAPHDGIDYPATSHLVAVDGRGNVVSFTTTVQIAFGSFVMVEGFLLNNQLTDFSFALEKDGKPIANRPEPGKRPRSSMTPTLVFDDQGRFRMAVGSPGGSRIISYVAKTVIGVLDWGLDIQAAIDLPNMVDRGQGLELERGSSLLDLADPLRAFGHTVSDRPLNSGVHAITATHTAGGVLYHGAADPRREGVALGD